MKQIFVVEANYYRDDIVLRAFETMTAAEVHALRLKEPNSEIGDVKTTKKNIKSIADGRTPLYVKIHKLKVEA